MANRIRLEVAPGEVAEMERVMLAIEHAMVISEKVKQRIHTWSVQLHWYAELKKDDRQLTLWEEEKPDGN